MPTEDLLCSRAGWLRTRNHDGRSCRAPAPRARPEAAVLALECAGSERPYDADYNRARKAEPHGVPGSPGIGRGRANGRTQRRLPWKIRSLRPSGGKVACDEQQPALDLHAYLVGHGLVAHTPRVARLESIASERPSQAAGAHALRAAFERDERDHLARPGAPHVLCAWAEQDSHL